MCLRAVIAIDGARGSGVRYDWDGDLYVTNDGASRSAGHFGAGQINVVKLVLNFDTRKFEFLLDDRSQVLHTYALDNTCAHAQYMSTYRVNLVWMQRDCVVPSIQHSVVCMMLNFILLHHGPLALHV